MSTSTNLPFIAPIAVMGLPVTAAGSNQYNQSYQSVVNAAQGGGNCFDWVFPYGTIQTLAQNLPSSAPVDDNSDYGDYYFSKNIGGYNVSIQSNTTLQEEVVTGNTPPTTYEQDGSTYNIIGSIEHTISFDNVQAWTIALPLMLSTAVPLSVLGSVGYKAFLKPIISSVYKGVKKALTTTVEDDMEAAAIEAAADLAAEAADIGELVLEEAAVDATLSLETGGLAFIGFVGLIAIQVGIMLIIHPSYHQLIIYNFTNYDLKWSDPELKHDAKITLEPVTDTTGDTMANTLPAMSASSPSKFVAPVNTASMAQFNVYSDSEIYGVKWGLSIKVLEPGTSTEVTDPVGVMWDIPLGSDNSIEVDTDVSHSDLDDWVDSQEGKHKVQTRSKDIGAGITVTNSIDYLEDKHPMTPGSDDDGYIYRSVLVFQQN